MGKAGLGSFGALYAEAPAEAPKYPCVARGVELPSSVELAIPTAVHDQGNLGSCVGQAFSRALEVEVGTGLEVSALAVYYDARLASGFPAGQDTGAYMEPAIQSLASYGAGSVTMYPQDNRLFATRPSIAYRRMALDHRVLSWYRARGVDEARSALAAGGHPCVTSFLVPPGFDETGSTGLWNDRGGEPLGGHAIFLFGYDDAGGGMFQAMNSWGEEWGNEGWFWLPYAAYAPGGRFFDSIVVTVYDEVAGS